MIKISVKQLQELGACDAGIKWFKNQKQRTLKTVVYGLMVDSRVDYARWLLTHLMTHPQKVLFAIFSAEQVISIFEDKYPNDKKPREAIQVAKDFLEGKVTADAAYAAADAAYAAAYAANAVAYAADAAFSAAYSGAYAAYAANAAAYAADDAFSAAYAANAAAYAASAAAYASKEKINEAIIAYGLELIGEGGR